MTLDKSKSTKLVWKDSMQSGGKFHEQSIWEIRWQWLAQTQVRLDKDRRMSAAASAIVHICQRAYGKLGINIPEYRINTKNSTQWVWELYPQLSSLSLEQLAMILLTTSRIQVNDMCIVSRETVVHPRRVIKLRRRVDLYYCWQHCHIVITSVINIIIIINHH